MTIYSHLNLERSEGVLTRLQHGKGAVGDMESMSPVVVGHITIILLDCRDEPD